MCNNSKNQDAVELHCLNMVRKNLIKTNCFGLSDSDFKDVENFLNIASANLESTKFPDFIFDNGIIEHFMVTSSSVTKKGAKQIIASRQLELKTEQDFLKKIEQSKETITTHRSTQFYQEHSLTNIRTSIKNSWEKHIKSLRKYPYEAISSIFLMQYADNILQTAEQRNNYESIVHDSYRITLDKHMLEWIYSYKDEVKYAILSNTYSTEIIKIESIPDISRDLPSILVAPVFGMETHSFIGGKIYRN